MENVVIAKHVFFLQCMLLLKNRSAGQDQMWLCKPSLVFSICERDRCFQEEFNESFGLFSPLSFSHSLLSVIGRLSCFIEQTVLENST